MSDLSERQEAILLSLIESYVNLAQPVGSQALVGMHRLNVSSATIRNEMGSLEEQGYITHPHTSAGRVPTDKGYRFYVNRIAEKQAADERMARRVMEHFSRKIRHLDELIELTAKVLSELSDQAALIFYPESEFLYFKNAKLVLVDPYHVLVGWTTTSGMVGHRLLELDEELTPALCEKVMRLLNEELSGRPLSELGAVLLHKLSGRRDTLRQVYELARRIVEESMAPTHPNIRLEGSDRMFDKPEFQDPYKMRAVLHLLNETDNELCRMVRGDVRREGVSVHIGRENPEAMHDFSVVTASYELAGHSAGSLALVGPRRMPYRQMMAIVRYAAQCFSGCYDRLYR